MKNRIPRGYVNVAALAQCVAENWLLNHPNYVVNFVDPQDLGHRAQVFRSKIIQNKQQTQTKKGNTGALEEVNARIDESVSFLKKYIKRRFASEGNLSKHYSDYGMEVIGKKNRIGIAGDNDNRSVALEILVDKLQEPNNPFANSDFGLSHWLTLQQDHQREWLASRKLKGEKSVFANETKALYQDTRLLLDRLALRIRTDFPVGQHKEVLRQMGFLAEVY